ncbi:MAG TPA: sulfotransferase domain-containing protein [Thermoanaerobaculia bacterium]|nr:sulfotransferase domain-containing protein [Thermoanaerobaculia bacterium]
MAWSWRWALRRLRYGAPVVVVSGLPRSGTSMAMKMLEAGGLTVVTDGVRTADEDNPRGYYEDERVKNLGEAADKGWLASARGKAVKIISFLLKDLPPNLNYQVVFMRRDLDEVLASQKKMLTHRGEGEGSSDEEMRELFQNHLWRAGYWLRHYPQFDTLEIDYRQVLAQPRREAERINAFLGGKLAVDRMVAVVDETLYRNRRAS